MSTLGYQYVTFDIRGIDEEKVLILIENELIQMNIESLNFMQDNYPECVIPYIRKNPKDFEPFAEPNVLTEEQIVELLGYKEFPNAIKLMLLNGINEEIAITNANYSEELLTHILENNFDTDDLPYLLRRYTTYSKSVQDLIYKIAKEHIQEVIDIIGVLNQRLLMCLLRDEEIELLLRAKLLSLNMKNLSHKNCIECLKFIHADELVKLFDKNNRPQIPISETNQILLASLVRTGYLKAFIANEAKGVYKYTRGRKIS